ncbi:chemotaxis protein CheW [Niallia sp. Krafla_26]|uniref:chemotaxis protein CheW n=1 Tax=Niallia sp. Krafla_26 TaxID=3064703 RepID=UPI003D17C43F
MQIMYIIFKLNNQFFGVEVNQVISIERLQPLTEVPGTAHFIKGIMPLRGEITPILDLKERLSMKKTTTTDENRILIINLEDIQIGLIVDEATGVIDIDSTSIEPPFEMISGVDNRYIKGIAKVDKKLLILLDLTKVTDQNENIQLHESSQSIN